MPDIGGRDGQVFGKGAVPVDADAAGLLAQVPPAGQAVAAVAADQVSLARNECARFEPLDV